MYSRSERKFLDLPKDVLNPRLGPGCYTSDEGELIAGKLLGNTGYAPFSSLTPRKSYFYENMSGAPPPGSYDPEFGLRITHKTEGSALFGRSKAKRFGTDEKDVPGPNLYTIPSTLKTRSKSVPPTHAEKEYVDAKHFSLEAPASSGRATSNREEIKGNLVWKRKYLPASIPKGSNVYGYKENEDGDMVPRNPPVVKQPEAPNHLFSFAEKCKHDKKGFQFPKNRQRLIFQTYPNPAPNQYDVPTTALKKSKSTNPAMMALSCCKRMTDEIIANSVKQSVPGPGAYDVKDDKTDKMKKTQIPKFGNVKRSANTYINAELMKIPGPGAYFPEQSANSNKVTSHKPTPFGSTSRRFSSMDLVDEGPAVGSYEIDENSGMFGIAKKKTEVYVGQPVAPFGSMAKRFSRKKIPMQPGPGAYEPITTEDFLTNGTANHRSKLQSRLQKLAEQGPATLVVGENQVLSSNLNIPVFGSQASRFANKTSELPPPGAYEIMESFNQLKTKGRIENTGILNSQCKREVFKVNHRVPGPAEYNPALLQKRLIRRNIGAFMSNQERFTEGHERLPGPGTFNLNSGLLKKSFNVTFKEDQRLKIQ